MRKTITAILCSLVLITGSILTVAGQTGTGVPVYYQHFGRGDHNQLICGPALPPAMTSLNYAADPCPPPGSYTIIRRVKNGSCFNNEWIPLPYDNSSMMDPDMMDGNMMLVNYTKTLTPQTVFVDTIRQTMCPGTRYEFSFALINLDNPIPCFPPVSFPQFAYNVETESGQVLFTDTIAGLTYASSFMGYHFNQYALPFTMPAISGRLVIRINYICKAAYDCAEDFALDDVKVSPLGPALQISFLNEPGTLVKSVCFQQNAAVTLTGTMDPYFTNPALQWQQSTDSGFTWTDIPGATAASLTQVFSVPDTFLFRLTGADAGNISNPGCRVKSPTLKVAVNGLPSVYHATSNSPVCSGSPLLFNAEGGASYHWTGPNGFNETSPFPHIYYSSLADSGMYYADIYTLGGCVARDSVRVKIIGVDVKAGTDTIICLGNTVKLFVSKGSGYEWTPAAGLNAATIQFPRASPQKTTLYKVIVTDTSGCMDSAKVLVTVRNAVPVKAAMDVNAHLCPVYDSLQFIDKSSGKISHWYWEFGNGNSTFQQQPPLQYYLSAPGHPDYVARLTVTDTAGCADTVYRFLHVEQNCYIAVPTAFTPNNDGLNDYLYPLNAFKVTGLLFRVFNRNGQLLFESRDMNRQWDGRFRGVEQRTGVYVWTMEYTHVNGRKIFSSGTCTLIR